MGEIIAISSGKGGTGKTTSVAAIASCLASMEHKTLCIDFDAGMGNLDLALGISDFAIMDYTDVLNGHIELRKAVRESVYIKNLYFLSAPISGELHLSDREPLIKMFTEIRNDYDYCVIDAPPGIGTGFKLAHCSTDTAIIVATCELPAMRDATRAAGALRELNINKIRLLVNRVNPKNLSYIRTTIDDVIDTTGVQLIGLVPEDKNVFRALHDNVPLILYYKRKSAYDFLDTARRITGEDIPLRQF